MLPMDVGIVCGCDRLMLVLSVIGVCVWWLCFDSC
jgi:hypothetical protein